LIAAVIESFFVIAS